IDIPCHRIAQLNVHTWSKSGSEGRLTEANVVCEITHPDSCREVRNSAFRSRRDLAADDIGNQKHVPAEEWIIFPAERIVAGVIFDSEYSRQVKTLRDRKPGMPQSVTNRPTARKSE